MNSCLKLTLVSLAALLTTAGPAMADVLIGIAGPFSGPNASLGEQIRRGVQMAVDDINATGGLRGERLAIAAGDDSCDPKKAVEVATGFVSLGVKFVAGHYCSGSSIPAAKVYEAAGIVQISPASTHPKFTDEGGWNVFRMCPRDDAQGTVAAKLVLSRFPGRRISILSDQSTSANALSEKFRAELRTAGVTAVLDETFKPGAKNYGPLAEKLTASLADVVYFAGSYVEGGLIVRALRELGSNAQLVAGDSLVSDDFWKIAKDAGEGTLMTFTYDAQKFDAARPLLAKFEAADYNPEGFTLYAYAAVQAWVQAAEATGGTDSHRIASWLRAGNRIRTVTGEVSFDRAGDLRDPKFAWFRWDNGRYNEIDPLAIQPPTPDENP